MTKYRNIFLNILFLLYIIFGSYLSLVNGISHDQFHEQLNWEINLQAVKGIIFNDGKYEVLLNYLDRYHGIAFHYISQPIQFLIHGMVERLGETSLEGSVYLSRHAAVFFVFSISGYFFYLLCLKISKDKNFSLVCVTLFLLYPYFFGHSQINGKDIPFLSVWIISTYFLFDLIEKFYNEQKIEIKTVFLISFSTAFLISIRITGVLILLEYLIALIILLNTKNKNSLSFLNENKIFFLLFSISLIFFVYVLNPIFWLNPLEFINSIKWMGKYYHDVCTLTLGSCMKALNLPTSYIFIWLFFKLPILILIGLAIFPLIEKKIFNNGVTTIYYGTLALSTLLLLFIFILKNVALYDEIRHIMFLIPAIFIISLYNLYLFNKKFFIYSSIFVIIFFVVENISLKKFQYTWLNSFAKLTDIQKNFEIDYMGVSNRNLQNQIEKYSLKNNISKSTCIYGNNYANIFLQKKGFSCFKTYSSLDSAKQRPLFAYQNARNIKRSDPKDCKLIFTDKYNYFFYDKDIITGKLWFCS